MGLIQTPDQLRFSYVSLLQGLKVDWKAFHEVSAYRTSPTNANNLNVSPLSFALFMSFFLSGWFAG